MTLKRFILSLALIGVPSVWAQGTNVAPFDPANAAATALTTAETYSSNASNLTSGTLSGALLPTLSGGGDCTVSSTGAVLTLSCVPHGILASVTGTGAAGSTTDYYSIFGTSIGTTAPAHQLPIPQAIKIKSMSCYINSGQPSTGSLTVSLGQCTPASGVCTPSTTGQPSVTFAASATASVITDTSHTPTYAAGDFMTIVAVNAATTTSATLAACTIAY